VIIWRPVNDSLKRACIFPRARFDLMPQLVQGGGAQAMLERLELPETRARVQNDVARWSQQ
jgi:hypothetical protein